jgi:hypothetical protein
MQKSAISYEFFRGRVAAFCARAVVLAALIVAGSLLSDGPAQASAEMSAAAANANAGLSACGNSRGKELYNCVGNVLDRMAGEVASIRVPETQRALQTAASRLRAATSKAEALSAVTQCRAAISGALRQLKAAGSATGWGDNAGALGAVVSVLSRAIQLIQTKG